MNGPVSKQQASKSGRTEHDLAVIAGNGYLPVAVAEALQKRKQDFLLIGIDGEIDAGLARTANAVFSFGQLGSLFKLLEEHAARRVVFAGGVVKRPDYLRMKKDLLTLREIPKLLKIVKGGDNSVLGKIAAYFNEKGYTVIGAHEIVPELLAEKGWLGNPIKNKGLLENARMAFRASKTVGSLDAGQAAVVEDMRVIALEGPEGTDGILERVAVLRSARRIKPSPAFSVLAKTVKPGQDLRADLPAIGPETIDACHAAGIRCIVIEAERTFVLRRKEVEQRAREKGVSILAMSVAEAEA